MLSTGTVAILLNPAFPPASEQLKDIEAAAKTIGQPIEVLRASTDGELEAAFATIARHRLPALLVASDPFFNVRRERLAELAARAGVPAMYGFRDYVVAGGLKSYGIELSDIYPQVGVYAGRILKGTKPTDLPVLKPTKFEFVINLPAAKTLGLEIPPRLLARADEVIE